MNTGFCTNEELVGHWILRNGEKQINYPEIEFFKDSTVELYSRADALYRYTYSLQNDVGKKNTKNKISLLKIICCPHYRKIAQRQKTIKYKTTYEKR